MRAAASHTPPDRTGELLAIASNQELARHISKEVRAAYKAGSGSSNKNYETRNAFSSKKRAAIEARQKTTTDLRQASYTLRAIRANNRQAREVGRIYGNPQTLKIDVANCGDLARAAAKRTIAHGGHAEVWEFQEQDHAFAVIGHPPENSTVNFKTWKDVWVVDPWANIVCKAPDYIQAINQKMHKWAKAGKVIIEDGSLSPVQSDWIKSLKYGEKIRWEAPSTSMKNPWQHVAFSIEERPLADSATIEPLPPFERKSSPPSLKKFISGLFTRKAG